MADVPDRWPTRMPEMMRPQKVSGFWKSHRLPRLYVHVVHMNECACICVYVVSIKTDGRGREREKKKESRSNKSQFIRARDRKKF